MNDLKAIRCNKLSVEGDSELKLMSQVLLTVANPDIVGPKTWTLYCGEGQDALVRKLFASKKRHLTVGMGKNKNTQRRIIKVLALKTF